MPRSLDVSLVVYPWEEILFEMIKCASRGSLVDAHQVTKRLLGLSSVLELGEHDFSVFCQEGARRVAVVGLVVLFAFHGVHQVLDQHGNLRGDGRERLRCRQTGGVAARPDVVVVLLLQSGLVHVHVAGLVGQSTGLHEVVGAHLRHGVQEVEFSRDLLARLDVRKGGIVAVDGFQVVLKQTLDGTLFTHLVELGTVFWHAKHDGQSGGKCDLDG